ncbi:PaaI family thioesterase [Vannielia litorea]|uniref:PaaI family thioesterase n=1 Tax=Vannielia litorea TaxID=1217970 RepID=UPI001C96DEDE|nr:PaaI family thioesterase [Vannielia litorea]MBY6048177.1 PaaI family thioesterase [Vannielia litorea]MBY6075591.1 PaaI family thioesterase [Vannielia litorea]
MTSIEDRIRGSFARQSMMATLRAEVAAVAEGRVTLTAPIADHVLQQHGYAHAGLAFSLADSAAGYSALSVMPADKEVLTIEMKINLIAPAAGTRLVAEGRVIKNGRRLVVVAADVFAVENETRRHCAVLQGTMIPA